MIKDEMFFMSSFETHHNSGGQIKNSRDIAIRAQATLVFRFLLFTLQDTGEEKTANLGLIYGFCAWKKQS